MNQQFWNTKKLLERKFGKKEDSSIVASDAELDLKLELFKSIQDRFVFYFNFFFQFKEIS